MTAYQNNLTDKNSDINSIQVHNPLSNCDRKLQIERESHHRSGDLDETLTEHSEKALQPKPTHSHQQMSKLICVNPFLELNSNLDTFKDAQTKQSVESYERNFNYYYLYVNGDKCNKIFTKRLVDCDTLFVNGEKMKAIVLLTIPPEFDDTTLLKHLYGANVAVDSNVVQCYIQFRKDILETRQKYLIKIDKYKYACIRPIIFGDKFPKHEFRVNFNRN